MIKRYVFLFAFLLCQVCLIETVTARSFIIDKFDVAAEVKIDGTVDFTETITYDFNGEFNGVTKSIDYASCGEFKNYSVSELDDDGEIKYTQAETASPNTFTISYQNDLANLKVFKPSSSTRRTFVFRYTLTKCLGKYPDIAELNRKLIGNNYDVPIRHFTGRITFEANAESNMLKIFAHGPLTGESGIENGSVWLDIKNLPVNTFIEARALFPPEYIKNYAETSDKQMLNEIMEYEGKLADSANAIRAQAKKVIYIRFFISIVLYSTLIFTLVILWIKNRPYVTDFDGEYYRELPADYTPSEMSVLFKSLGSKDIIATLLDLTRRKMITIEPCGETKGLIKKQQDYVISLLDNQNATAHEQTLLNWFIGDIGNKTQVKMSEIKKYSERHSKRFVDNYKTWQDTVELAAETHNFFEENNSKLFSIIISITCAVLSFVFVHSVLIIAFSIIICVYALTIKRRSSNAQDEYKKWLAFKKFLKDFSNMNHAEIGSIVLWEHYLVYAVSLGVAKDVINQLPKVFSSEELHSNNLTLLPMYCSYPNSMMHFDNINASFKNAITSANAIANSQNSSRTGSGGGFSGGSSGGSGGRGGGGAF